MLQIDLIAVQRPGLLVQVRNQQLPPAQPLSIIGPSGGGKSTFLRALVGLEPEAQTRGLRWQQQDLTHTPPHRRPFAWLPQELGLWPHLDALSHLALARTRGASLDANDDDHQLLDQVGLGPRARALPGRLSGGEQQRLALARVLAQRPAWALLDEPFSHLDPVLADRLSTLCRQLAAERGMGLIQVSHQLRHCPADEQVWVLEGGTLVQVGRWADVQQNPATPWIERFVALQA